MKMEKKKVFLDSLILQIDKCFGCHGHGLGVQSITTLIQHMYVTLRQQRTRIQHRDIEFWDHYKMMKTLQRISIVRQKVVWLQKKDASSGNLIIEKSNNHSYCRQ